MTQLEPRLVGFANALRSHGVSAGTSDVIDATAVVAVLGLVDRERLRAGLASALLRRGGQRHVFDDLFDLWFPAALGPRTGVEADDALPADPAARRALADHLRRELADALAAADDRALEHLAARVVATLGRLPNEATTGTYSATQALELLAPQLAIARTARLLAGGGDAGQAGGDGANSPSSFTDRFARDQARNAVDDFRRRVQVETRRRNAEARGRSRISHYAVPPPADHVPFALSGRLEIEELRAIIAPLATKLATRLEARRRRARRGEIVLRQTLRRSLSTGGVPLQPVYRRRAPHRPDIVLLCDLSSSVAGFSRFMVVLMQALAGQFRRVRVFGFINVCDELTDLLPSITAGTEPSRALAGAALTRWHSHSDYGGALTDFADRYLETITTRTTLVILGDARTNNTDPRADILAELATRARSAHWLNPEAARQWDTADSVASAYGQIIDMHECANAAQLRLFVDRVLP